MGSITTYVCSVALEELGSFKFITDSLIYKLWMLG